MTKKLDTLVSDIYKKISVLSEGKAIEIPDHLLKEFGINMSTALKEWAIPRSVTTNTGPTLRMSNLGKPDRQLWFDLNSEKSSGSIPESLYIKFLYGHLLEVLMLFFVRLSGHKVEAEQKEVKVDGIVGHMDCVIDGEVVDVKTASGYAFKKFKNKTLPENDTFGYLAQLAAYEEAMGTSKGGFLALNKETGEIALFIPEDLDKPNIKSRITEIKKIIKRKKPPEFCYNPVPEGLSGNLKLARECNYCSHKFKCHANANKGKGLRVFDYAKGPVYFTKIVKPPKVSEITK
tara:strand:+ start:1797 stop:2666 length:870 start_codon:yes stop_codon:yes gene_type:complete